MAVRHVLLANDQPLSELGFWPTRLDGWWHGIRFDRDVSLPHDSFAPSSGEPRALLKEWPLELFWHGDRVDLQDALDSLAKVLVGKVEWRTIDSERVAFGVVRGVAPVDRDPDKRKWDVGDALVRVDVLMDPGKYDRWPSSLALTTTGRRVPMGTAGAKGVVRIVGPATAPTLRTRRWGSDLVDELVLEDLADATEGYYVHLDELVIETIDLTAGPVVVARDNTKRVSGWWPKLGYGDALTIECTDGDAVGIFTPRHAL